MSEKREKLEERQWRGNSVMAFKGSSDCSPFHSEKNKHKSYFQNEWFRRSILFTSRIQSTRKTPHAYETGHSKREREKRESCSLFHDIGLAVSRQTVGAHFVCRATKSLCLKREYPWLMTTQKPKTNNSNGNEYTVVECTHIFSKKEGTREWASL